MDIENLEEQLSYISNEIKKLASFLDKRSNIEKLSTARYYLLCSQLDIMKSYHTILVSRIHID